MRAVIADDGGRERRGLGGNRAGDAALIGAGAELNDRGSGGELQDRNAAALGRRHDGVEERAGGVAFGRLDDRLIQFVGEGERWFTAVEEVVEEPDGQAAGRRSHLLVLVVVDDAVHGRGRPSGASGPGAP